MRLRQPGDFDFDPLGLYVSLGSSPMSRRRMVAYEVWHGRVAMLAVFGYWWLEHRLGQAVVDITPVFFRPFWAL